MKLAIKTLGCKVNRYESDSIGWRLKGNYELVSEDQDADIYVVNTCTVTHSADRKSIAAIRHLKNAHSRSKVVVFGCGVRNPLNNYGKLKEIDHLFKTYDEVIAFLKNRSAKDGLMTNNAFNTRTRALIKIQDGCDNYCSYCIIPFTRGKGVSYPLRRIISEINDKVALNYKEIVLTGVNIGEWREGTLEFHDLVKRILDLSKIERVRISSIEPKAFPAGFYSLFKNSRLCGHLHLSVQTGSDFILKKMRRRYDSALYTEVCEELWKVRSDMAITTDMIVGFPGETEELFEETLKFSEKIGFSKIHVFPYSKRDGTIAIKAKDHISEKIKSVRCNRLRALSEKLKERFITNNLGRHKKVLFEHQNSDGNYEGLTDNYIRVKLDSEEDLKNQIREVVLCKENVEI